MPDTTPPPETCRNCGVPLMGAHCYACGQPVSGLVRPLGNLFGDLLDSVFNIDARIVRTLGPLFTKPGFLSAEYFAGRQVRYVTPVRLFFFLCIMAFFIARFALDTSPGLTADPDHPTGIGAANSEAEVIQQRDAALKSLNASKAQLHDGPGRGGAEAGIDAGIREVRATADARMQALRDAAAKGEPPPPPMEQPLTLNGRIWDAKTNPVHLTGAPGFVDAWLNGKIGRARHNVTRIKADPSQYVDAFVGAIPTALFVLVPIFALMLKLTYLLKRRLYMEHVVVALHSHAFISLDLLLVFACMLLQRQVADNGVLDDVLAWCIGLLVAWVPVYLLLMQKRVYAQGWPMTLLKFLMLGTLYSVLLGFAISAAAIASLVWL